MSDRRSLARALGLPGGGEVLRPYPEPPEPGVVAHVVMARSAKSFLPDIEALLVEYGLPATLAPTVADLVDVSGWSIREAVARIEQVIVAFPPAIGDEQ